MFFFFTREEFAIMRDPAWDRLVRALDHVRLRYPNMTVGTLVSFIQISQKQDANYASRKTLTEIADALDIPYPTFTRQTDHLGEGSGGREGLGLIKKINLPDTQKSKGIDVTPRGISLLQEIHRQISNGTPQEPKLTRPTPNKRQPKVSSPSREKAKTVKGEET